MEVNTNTIAMKIRLNVDAKQHKILQKWFGLYRMAYNDASDYISKSDDYISDYKIPGKYNVRNYTLDYKNMSTPERINTVNLLKQCPAKIIKNAPLECVSNYKTAKTLFMKKGMQYKTIDRWSCYRRKKDITQSMSIEYNAITNSNNSSFTMLPKIFGDGNISPIFEIHKSSLSDWIKINCVIARDFKIVYQEGIYYACIPYDTEILNNASNTIGAFDPGYRTFLTCADNEGKINIIGNDLVTKLDKFANAIMKYKHKIQQIKDEPYHTKAGRKSIRINQKHIDVLRSKAHKYVNDYHCKAAKYLAMSHAAIVAPELSSIFYKNGNKTLKEIIKTDLMSHYKFTQKLKHACNMYGCTYLYSKEYYTSKTCAKCGHQKTGIYTSKHFDCSSCGHTDDRDINGAKNILTRFLTKTQI